jgi:hypothetical protein
MEEETVTLPKPPEGFEYKIVRKKSVRNTLDLKDRDTTNLTPVQLSKLRYKIENKDKVKEQNKLYYERNKERIKEQKRLEYEAKKSVPPSDKTSKN